MEKYRYPEGVEQPAVGFYRMNMKCANCFEGTYQDFAEGQECNASYECFNCKTNNMRSTSPWRNSWFDMAQMMSLGSQ